MRSFSNWNAIALSTWLGCIIVSVPVDGQPQYQWQELSDAPFVNRYNDVFFVDENTGWVVHGGGEIYKTFDGGQTWQLQYTNLNAHFRSVGFLNSEQGFAGNVGPDEFGAVEITPLFETQNGGQTWLPAGPLVGEAPKGICGMQVVNDSTVVAVGRVRGPAHFVRTTNAGDSWISKDMSAFAAGLIDVHFSHPDSGFVVGLTNSDHNKSSGVILKTVDGGETWTTVFTTSRAGEWAWKINFPVRSTGYVSLQRNTESPIFILRTRDSGDTWEEVLFQNDHYFVQGLGFVDSMTGWIGGNSSQPVYVTTDGGDTWTPEEVRPRINRIRFVNDSTGFAVGRSVYSVKRVTPTSISPVPDVLTMDMDIFPNPFSSTITVSVTTREPLTRVYVVDAVGRLVTRLTVPQENFTLMKWDGMSAHAGRVSAGVYFVVAETERHTITKPVLFMPLR